MSQGKKKNAPFNNPMSGALQIIAEEIKKTAAPQPPPKAIRLSIKSSMSDDEVFFSEMADVKPIDRPSVQEPERKRPEILKAKSDDEEVMLMLDDLVSGSAQFDITATGEYVEGIFRDLDRRTLKKLKQGDFSREAEIDLHQMTVTEAKPAVATLIRESRLTGRRCIKIIHGRGLHSKEHTPILKEAVLKWLSGGSLSKNILAFCSACPGDGGIGALYVLLRK